MKGPTYQLIEIKFGSYPFEVVVEGWTCRAGSPIAWKPAQIAAGQIEGFRPDGTAAVLRWDEVAAQPGWCKLDWVVADPVRGRLANASNMLDVTWEAPDGAITPLDGYLDPYFQEVYLDAESVPIFSKLAQHVSADALDDYVAALEHEAKKYLTTNVNYGKAAKRMYNILRLTGRYSEAMFIRIADKANLANDVNAWQNDHNEKIVKVDWRFTATDARIKLKHLYPIIHP